MIKRFHRQLKDSLRARLAGAAWPDHLPWVLLGLRAAPKEDSGISSAEMVYGAPLTLPGEFLDLMEQPTSEVIEKIRAGPTSVPTRPLPHTDKPSSLLQKLQAATHVYVQRGNAAPPLTPLYQGPYAVKNRGPKYRSEVISVDRLKPHLGTAPVTPAQPPRRGRSPLQQPDRPPDVSASILADSSLGGAPVGARVERIRE